jgi:hypothetical protein
MFLLGKIIVRACWAFQCRNYKKNTIFRILRKYPFHNHITFDNFLMQFFPIRILENLEILLDSRGFQLVFEKSKFFLEFPTYVN